MKDNFIYLDTYLLQQDMRVRMPKNILENLNAVKGKTKFDIYYNKEDNSLIFRVNNQENNYEKKEIKDDRKITSN